MLCTECASDSPFLIELTHSAYFGGSEVDDCDDVTVDAAGHVYLACHATSVDFPGIAPGESRAGDMDGYVAKFDPQNGQLLYSTRLGGSAYDGAFAVRVDAAGRAWVVGLTKSADFPTTDDGLQRSYAGGDGDVFLARLGSGGDVEYATMLGGAGGDHGMALALGSEGEVYLGGNT